jgi:transcriptional regulator with XRE-family HTH domain
MNIKKVIKAQGWTLERIAAEMGISQPSVSSIVNGNPQLDKLQAIAKIIGVSVSELLADEEESGRTKIRCPHCGKDIRLVID